MSPENTALRKIDIKSYEELVRQELPSLIERIYGVREQIFGLTSAGDFYAPDSSEQANHLRGYSHQDNAGLSIEGNEVRYRGRSRDYGVSLLFNNSRTSFSELNLSTEGFYPLRRSFIDRVLWKPEKFGRKYYVQTKTPEEFTESFLGLVIPDMLRNRESRFEDVPGFLRRIPIVVSQSCEMRRQHQKRHNDYKNQVQNPILTSPSLIIH